jgi:hypothetical protein
MIQKVNEGLRYEINDSPLNFNGVYSSAELILRMWNNLTVLRKTAGLVLGK